MIEKLKEILQNFGLEYFGKYYGIYKGVVADNNDPENLGRVKLIVPQVYGEGKTFDYWAFPKGMYAGNDYGMYVVPEKGDTVWVQFEGGSARYPVWEYGWFGKGETPKEAKPSVKLFRTPSGHQIKFDDSQDTIEIKKSDGTLIKMVGKKINIVGGIVQIDGAQAIPNVSGGLNCISQCPYIGIKHFVDKTITGK